ncbi:AMP-binding protein (plasmid) [Rhodococcus opacus]|uniref:AMP-binding protein n=1 Tax=Rhodococcus opacus TaxID=37919 RepID=UPI001FF640F6|nr:AMP-binding protein [Rhodococcus opacus]UOT08449.1 AMP-binding protein [Rhodococcus opacus]
MSVDIDARVREILSSYAGDGTNVAWLLCDRHPPESLALTVVDEDLSTTRYTHGDLAESSRRFAQVLTDRGIRPGDRVATLMGKGTDLVSVLLGIWRVGAVYVPLFTAFAEDAVTSRLANSETKLVVVDGQYRSKISTDGPWEILVAGDGDDTLTALGARGRTSCTAHSHIAASSNPQPPVDRRHLTKTGCTPFSASGVRFSQRHTGTPDTALHGKPMAGHSPQNRSL